MIPNIIHRPSRSSPPTPPHPCAPAAGPRLLSTFAFQGRLGVIVRTLYHIVPPISHLVLVFLTISIMFSFMAHLVLGTYYGPMATLGGSIADTFGMFSGYSSIRDVDQVVPPQYEMLGVQKLAATLVLVAQTLLVVLVLLNFVFAVLGATFMKLKYSYSFMYGTTLWQVGSSLRPAHVPFPLM